MIALAAALLLQGTPLPVGDIGRQALPKAGCAAYLWSAGADRQLIAMAGSDPAQLRLRLDGKITDYARSAATGIGALGFGAREEYRGGDVTATLELTIVVRPELTQGGIVQSGTLRIERQGRDGIVLPVAGLVGCAAQSTR